MCSIVKNASTASAGNFFSKTKSDVLIKRSRSSYSEVPGPTWKVPGPIRVCFGACSGREHGFQRVWAVATPGLSLNWLLFVAFPSATLFGYMNLWCCYAYLWPVVILQSTVLD